MAYRTLQGIQAALSETFGDGMPEHFFHAICDDTEEAAFEFELHKHRVKSNRLYGR